MRYILAVLVLIGSACAAPQIQIPAGAAAITYAHAYGDYQVVKILVVQACASGKWDKQACDEAAAINTRAGIYKDTIEGALLNPTQPIDWAQVAKYSEEVIAILIKLGVLGAGLP